MTSPHIDADPGTFADTVLLPGDPRRAQHIAGTLLEDAVEVTDVRDATQEELEHGHVHGPGGHLHHG